ncbi:MAG: hypothetical protein ACK50P_02850, partial [Planctomycetaceae bacterium]
VSQGVAVFFESLSRMISRLAADPDSKQVLRQLAQIVLDSTSGEGPVAYAPAGETAPPLRRMRVARAVGTTDGSFDEGISPRPAVSGMESESIRGVDLGGRARTGLIDAGRSVGGEKFVPVDFALIEQRCRLKAEGARWAVARRRLLANRADFTTDVEPLDRDLIARAKLLPNCFLWLNHPNGPSSNDASRYDEVAACFETLAEAVALVRSMEDDKDRDPVEFENALNLLAEAQSMLRISVVKFDNYADTDQRDVFQWLKHTANEQQIFIRRFMRLDDPGDPNLASDLQARIKAASGSVVEARKRIKQQKKVFSKLKHKCQLIQDQPESADDYWPLVYAMVDELYTGGVPSSHRDFRDSLLPIIEAIPEIEELPRSMQAVVKDLERHLDTSPDGGDEPLEDRPHPDVLETGRLLKGRSLVLVGGDRRESAEQALIDALGLKAVHWVSTQDQDGLESLESAAGQPDVALVLLAIRWSSHSYTDVKAICEKHHKPLVRLPGGFSINQVASQVMAQTGGRLDTSAVG